MAVTAWRRLGWALVLGWFAWRLVPLVRAPDQFQWNVKSYWAAAHAVARGLDPYPIATLRGILGEPTDLPFGYPPAVAHALRPLSLLPYRVAAWAFLLLKFGCLAVLWRVWRRLLPQVDPLLVAFLAVFGFGGALLVDLYEGNVSVLEQLALWSGVLAWRRGRPWPAAVLLALAGAFKLFPAVFVLLLLVPDEQGRRQPLPMAAGMALLAAIVLIPGPPGSSYFAALANAPHRWESGRDNPCALGFFVDLARAGKLAFLAPGSRGPMIAWTGYAIFMLGLGLKPLREALRRAEPLAVAMIAVIVYAVAAPRMKSYSYLILVPPAAWLLTHLPPRGWLVLAACLLCGLPAAYSVAFTPAILALLRDYHSWLAALALWAIAVAGTIWDSEAREGEPPGEPFPPNRVAISGRSP